MKRRLVAWILFAGILLPITLFAAGDKQTKNTVPSASVSFLTDLQTFLKEENAERYADLFTGMVVSGGYHGTVAGLTGSPGATTAYPGGFLITETATITYPDADRCWVIVHSLRTGNLGTFTRVAGTHYLTDCASGAKPALPSGTIWLMDVTTAGGAITVVTDLRNRVSIAGTYELLAELPSAGTRARIAYVQATALYYFDNGTVWIPFGGIVPSYTKAGLPAAGIAGRLARVTDEPTNPIWMDTGSVWVPISIRSVSSASSSVNIQIGPDGGTVPSDMSNNGHLIRSNVAGNVLTIQMMQNSGYSTIRFVNENGVEFGAIGRGNSGSGVFYTNYWETLNDAGGTFETISLLASVHGAFSETRTRVSLDSNGEITLRYVNPAVAGYGNDAGRVYIKQDQIHLVGKIYFLDSVNGNVKTELIIPSTNTATVGAVTINKPSGRVRIAAGGTSMTLTNSLIIASSHVFCNVATNDATAKDCHVTTGSGWAVIYLNAAATAEVEVDFFALTAG